MTKAAVDGLRATHADMADVFESLSDADWNLPSACAGWRVQDVLAHVTSNFKEMIEPTPAPADVPPVSVKAEEAMEMLVAPRKTWSPAELMAEYQRYGGSAFAALGAMQDEPTASTEIPIADLGTYALHWLANAYCFDHYCHLRHDLMKPLGPLSNALAPADDLRLRPGIEWMIAGLPQMCTDALSKVTKPIVLELTGAGAGTWTVYRAGANGLATLVEERDRGAVATVSSSAHDFVSWGTQRSAWRESCTLAGDTDYVSGILDAINII